LYGSDGKEVLLAEPSYFGFTGFVQRVKGKMHPVRVNDRYEHDLDAMERKLSNSIGLTYICNPNNPTGTVVDAGKLRAFCEEAARHSMVFVDEAYNELVEDPRYESMIDLVKKGRNVMVSRTFSKIHGLAGLRVGYGIAKPDIISEFRRIQTNFAPISALSLAAAAASYRDTEYIEFCKKKNIEAKEFFYRLLGKMGKFYIRSHTNFVIYEIDRKADDFVKEVQKHKIHLRPFEFLGKHWIRVSMGTMEEMKKLASTLPKVT
jgi:histidinol-phosphate aminotransferase